MFYGAIRKIEVARFYGPRCILAEMLKNVLIF